MPNLRKSHRRLRTVICASEVDGSRRLLRNREFDALFETVTQSQTVHTTRGIQQPLLFPATAPVPAVPLETKGVVYTKRWVVELLLDLAGYRPENNLVDATAVEPAAGEGAFLGPMIERLLESCRQFGRQLNFSDGGPPSGEDRPFSAFELTIHSFTAGGLVQINSANFTFAGR